MTNGKKETKEINNEILLRHSRINGRKIIQETSEDLFEMTKCIFIGVISHLIEKSMMKEMNDSCVLAHGDRVGNLLNGSILANA